MVPFKNFKNVLLLNATDCLQTVQTETDFEMKK